MMSRRYSACGFWTSLTKGGQKFLTRDWGAKTPPVLSELDNTIRVVRSDDVWMNKVTLASVLTLRKHFGIIL